ncbi:DUF5994 family protein [Actinoplanes sp. NPDC051513]|uniref:DUF5994 family protein n=1 Tax=Actinoplanes sp. NPDC051513 TaxID=3363908 RepID=UPI0037B69BA6
MASSTYQPDPTRSLVPPRVRLEPIRDHHTMLDGSWWPGSGDLGVELRLLVPVLEHVRGPVTRLLLSAVGWTTRPPHVMLDGRRVSVGYRADQSPSMMTVLCADGGTFIMRVAPRDPVSGLPELPETRLWEEATDGGLDGSGDRNAVVCGARLDDTELVAPDPGGS